jgi:predicted ATPase/DNA-binding SARP family transcriptional activator
MDCPDPRVEIRLLGELRVVVDGQPLVDFDSDKHRALLAYLTANAPQTFRRETLAGLLWPDSSERAARASLRNALAQLRGKLADSSGKPLFDITYHSVGVHPDGAWRIDVVALDAAVAAAHAPDTVKAVLERAVDLYTGPFMAGFSLRNCPEFEAWMTIQREHYQRSVMELLDRLADDYEAQGDQQAAIDVLHRQLEHEPGREVSHRRLMELLTVTGRRSEALEQFRRCRRALTAELGVTPDAATEALYTSLRDEAGLPEPMRVKLPLPDLVAPLIGREQELDALAALLSAPDARLITVVGEGGTGKTHIAISLAHRVHGQYPDGVAFIALAALDQAANLPIFMLSALGFDVIDAAAPWQQLARVLRDKRMLLVLDNMEHLTAAAAPLHKFLRGTPYLTLLCTSRVRLNISDEHVFRLKGLTMPSLSTNDRLETVAAMHDHGAIQLFLASARRPDPSFALTADNAASIAAICRTVGGLPLGIILAAGWMDTMSPAAVAAQLAQPGRAMFEMLESDTFDLPERHRCLWSIIGELWSLLSAREQEILAGLAIFRGTFDMAAARAVTGCTPVELHRLVASSCVQGVTVDDDARFIVHELLRQFGLESLQQTTWRLAEVHERHAEYYIELAVHHRDQVRTSEQPGAMQRFANDSDNLRVAWEWCARTGRIDLLSRGLDPLCFNYEGLARVYDGEALCMEVVTHVDATASADAMYLSARACGWLAVFCNMACHYDEGLRYRELARSMLDQLEAAGHSVTRERGMVLLRVAHSCLYRDDYATLDVTIDAAQEAFRRIGDQHLESQTYGVRLYGALNRGRFYEALRISNEGMVQRQGVRDIPGLGWAVRIVGEIRLQLGMFAQAKTALERAIEYFRITGDRRAMSQLLSSLALMYTWMGDPERGVIYAAESQTLLEEFGVPLLLAAEQCSAHSEVVLHAGRYTQAREMLENVLRTSVNADSPWLANAARNRLAKLALVEDDPEAALALLDVSIPALRAIERSDELGEALALRATCLLRQGDVAGAHVALAEGLAVGIRAGHYATLCACLPTAALFANAEGKPFLAAAQRALSDVSRAAAAAFYAGRSLHDVLTAWQADL